MSRYPTFWRKSELVKILMSWLQIRGLDDEFQGLDDKYLGLDGKLHGSGDKLHVLTINLTPYSVLRSSLTKKLFSGILRQPNQIF